MIITINGDHGSGKTTIAKMIASDLGYDFYYTGRIFRQIAAKQGITYAQLMERMKTDESIDREVDRKTKELGKKEDDLVIDSRMAWYFIPQSAKIFFKVNKDIGAKRIYEHLKSDVSGERGNEDRNLDSVARIKESNRKRKEADSERYNNLYGVDIWNEKNYDFVIDTSALDIRQVHKRVLNHLRNIMDEA